MIGYPGGKLLNFDIKEIFVMAKYSRMERFGITIILILVVIVVIGIVLVLTNKGNEESIIIEEVEKANQQISEDTQLQEALQKGNDEKVEFPGSKPAEKIKEEEYNKEIDRSKPELVF